MCHYKKKQFLAPVWLKPDIYDTFKHFSPTELTLNQISQAQPDKTVVSQIIPAGLHLSWAIWASGSERGSQFPTSSFDREAKQDKM